ncbi:MAG: DUF374 domain-containing protein [Candidatus Aminicenantes bacterium]|nr:DUF374 domain-containing protein [Candidatus Aminicenantes bacterium]
MTELRKGMRWQFIGRFGKILFWLWHRTARIQVVGAEAYDNLKKNGVPVVTLVWHGRIFIMPYFFRHRGAMALISPSEDGEITAQITARWGFKVVRGSGSHAMYGPWKALLRQLRQKGEVIIVADGPKGPACRLKAGGVQLARQTDAVIVPFTFSAARIRRLRSWDSFVYFRPFSRVVAVYGRPFRLNSCLDDRALEEKRLEIEEEMIRLDHYADGYFKR